MSVLKTVVVFFFSVTEQTDFFNSTNQDFNVTIYPKEIRTFFIYFK